MEHTHTLSPDAPDAPPWHDYAWLALRAALGRRGAPARVLRGEPRRQVLLSRLLETEDRTCSTFVVCAACWPA